MDKGIETPMSQGRSTKIISMIEWIWTSRLSMKNSLFLSRISWDVLNIGGLLNLVSKAFLWILNPIPHTLRPEDVTSLALFKFMVNLLLSNPEPEIRNPEPFHGRARCPYMLSAFKILSTRGKLEGPPGPSLNFMDLVGTPEPRSIS